MVLFGFVWINESVLVKDEEQLLFHSGMEALFPAVGERVASVMDLLTMLDWPEQRFCWV